MINHNRTCDLKPMSLPFLISTLWILMMPSLTLLLDLFCAFCYTLGCRPYFILFFFKFYFIFKLYIIVLVLPNIKMNPPQVYMCSPS